jgi:hypothetical protein
MYNTKKTEAMRIHILIFFTFLITGQVFAHTLPGSFTTDERINSLINRLPAENSAVLDKIMSELSTYGGQAILNVAPALVPPGQGDDTAQRYLVSGLVKYVSQASDQFLTLQVSSALCTAVGITRHDEVKDFLFQELQFIAGDEAVITAAGYLNHARLSDPAARVLININSEASKGALLHGLASADLPAKLAVVQAVGETKYRPASSVLRDLSSTRDKVLRKAVFRSLAETADILSAVQLAAEAEKTGYDFEPTDAAGSYLLLLRRIAESGNKSFAEERLRQIIDNAQVPEHTRSAAISILDAGDFYNYTLDEDEQSEGFVPLFNGVDLHGWTGNKIDYYVDRGMIVCEPTGRGSGNLYTDKEYSDFIVRFEFKLTPGANNGLGIRTPLAGDAAYVGMELQILDDEADRYKNLQPWQYHGSIYGVIAAERGHLRPVGEWNYQEVYANGSHIRIVLNGETILDGDIYKASKGGTETLDNRSHPGLLNKSGHIGFLGHGDPLKFRNIRIRDLNK